MITATTALDSLKRQRPEWVPWLAVVEEVVREVGSPDWDRMVPAPVAARGATAPLLTGASVAIDSRLVRRLLDRIVRRASASGTEGMATLESALRADVDVVALFTASVDQESDRLKQVAAALGADAEAMQAIAALLPLPFLQACNRRWARATSESWVEGYCPVCGSWPTLAEVRGIERSRHYRCGRCGSEWYARAIVCAFCGLSDHEQLTSLVPSTSDAHAVVDACNGCHGYVKAFTRLQGCPASAVLLEDLASVDLDIAALERGYARPAGSGYRVGLALKETQSRRRFFGWNA